MHHWDLPRLFAAPDYRVLATDGPIQSVLFSHETCAGRPTDVFGYVGIPSNPTGPVPAMVCVHGGLGAAFRSWVEEWVNRGYAAIAMDLNGCGANRVPLPRPGPAMNDEVIFNPALPWTDSWTYHAVAAVIRAHTLLRGLPSVDPARIGITGVSWGGYLTCIAAGLDPRLACAIPIYGCGFLQTNCAQDWQARFAAMTPAQRQGWHERCDPSMYLPAATAPMLFVSGTNDFAYPLASVRKTYALPRSSVAYCIRAGMPHSQEEGIAPAEIAWFADQHLRRGEPLPTIENPKLTDGRLTARASSARPVQQANLLFTTDRGRWQDRPWQTRAARLENGFISADVPAGTSACLLSLTDTRGATITSAPVEIP